jgi:hypothetical protein
MRSSQTACGQAAAHLLAVSTPKSEGGVLNRIRLTAPPWQVEGVFARLEGAMFYHKAATSGDNAKHSLCDQSQFWYCEPVANPNTSQSLAYSFGGCQGTKGDKGGQIRVRENKIKQTKCWCVSWRESAPCMLACRAMDLCTCKPWKCRWHRIYRRPGLLD